MTTASSRSGSTDGRTAAVILAAGLGTRMRSKRPKVLHPLCGRPMLAYVLDAWEALVDMVALTGRAVVVYSPATESMTEVGGQRAGVALQAEPLGTGDAVRAALDALPGDVDEILVLSGDV